MAIPRQRGRDQATNALVNIGLTERRLRLGLGLLMLAAGLAATVLLATSSAVWPWALLLLLVYYQGIRFVLDYRTGTCPLKAELGQRRLDAKFSIMGEPVEDPGLARRIRSVSRRALVQAALAAIVLWTISMAVILKVAPWL